MLDSKLQNRKCGHIMSIELAEEFGLEIECKYTIKEFSKLSSLCDIPMNKNIARP
jgi:hypothetical protein